MPQNVGEPTVITDAVLVKSTDSLLADAKTILERELSHFRQKTRDGMMLDTGEANILTKYVDILIKLSREEREQSKYMDFSQLSDEELKKALLDITTKKDD